MKEPAASRSPASPPTATAHYYTSRFAAGDMDFTLLDRSTAYGTFAEAQAADPRPVATLTDPLAS
ncbi:hypothetical protein [Streptomyces sp. NPDC003077]|uniref:hypothetical protein n=1 Tax=Streptomyces sp. NPDC003077 TaxID=3154443 RepID=UPI0033BDF749